MRWLIFIVWFIAASAIAGTREVTVSPGVAEVRVPATGDIDVSWEARKPIDLRYVSHLLQSDESSIVFCAAAGKQYIVVSDVIYWEERRREKTTWIVTVSGDAPTPDPDDPIDPEPDDPDPKPPVNVPNKYGIGPEVFSAARKVVDRSSLPTIVSALKTLELALNASRITGADAISRANNFILEKQGWQSVASSLTASIQQAASQYGSGMTDVKNYLREARLALELLQ